MAESIPFTPGVPFQSLEVTLAGVAYILEARWNARDNGGLGSWYLNLLETSEKPIMMGMKLVLGTFLGRSSTHPFFVGRALFAIDESNTGIEAGLDDLGARVTVMYFTELDLQLARQPPKAIPRDD